MYYFANIDIFMQDCPSSPWKKVKFWICLEKGKAIPLQTWTGPECSRRLRLPNFKAIGI